MFKVSIKCLKVMAIQRTNSCHNRTQDHKNFWNLPTILEKNCIVYLFESHCSNFWYSLNCPCWKKAFQAWQNVISRIIVMTLRYRLRPDYFLVRKCDFVVILKFLSIFTWCMQCIMSPTDWDELRFKVSLHGGTSSHFHIQNQKFAIFQKKKLAEFYMF